MDGGRLGLFRRQKFIHRGVDGCGAGFEKFLEVKRHVAMSFKKRTAAGKRAIWLNF
jgi:hypothetical protein